jgi:hypothetical protein
MSQAALDLFTASATTDAESAAYWAYHLGRTGFFLATVRAGRGLAALGARPAGGEGAAPEACPGAGAPLSEVAQPPPRAPPPCALPSSNPCPAPACRAPRARSRTT